MAGIQSRLDLLPAAPPIELAPTRMAMVTVSLGSGAFAGALFSPGTSGDTSGAVLMTVATMIVAAVITWRALQRENPWLSMIAAGALCGAILALGSLCYSSVVSLVTGGSATAGGISPFTAVLAAVVGGHVGALLSATALIVVLPTASAEESDSLDRLDRVMLPAGLWLVVVAGLAFLARPQIAVVSGPATLVALGALLLVAIRDGRRTRWLARLFRGDLPDLRVTSGPRDATPLFGAYRDEDATGRIIPAPPDPVPEPPYRTALPEVPPGPPKALARLPMDLAAARRPFRRRQWIAISSLVLAIAALIRLLSLRLGW